MLAALPLALLAQRYSFKQYGQDQGLTNLDTYALMQDRTGFLWVGTEGGLFRYDGRQFRAYTTAEGLPSAQVVALHQTPDGVIWAASSSGLARMAGEKFERVDIDAHGASTLASDAAGRLYIGASLGLWIGSPPGPDGQRTFQLFPGPGRREAAAGGIAIDASGRVWFGRGSGICRLEHGKLSRLDDWAVPPAGWQSLLVDRHGNLWARSKAMLIELPRGTRRFLRRDRGLPIAGRNPSIAMDRDGDLFVPTTQGLARQSDRGWELIRRAQGLPISAVDFFLQDREGSVWLALDGGGIVRWLGYKQWEIFTESEGLSDDVVWGLARDQTGTLWAATQSGISRLDPRARKWQPQSNALLSMTPSLALQVDDDGALWIGQSPGGLIRLDRRTGRIERYYPTSDGGREWIYSLLLDSRGRLWAGTGDGLVMANRTRRPMQFHPVSLPFSRRPTAIFAMLEDSRSRIWAATSLGLACLEEGRWRTLSTRDGLRHDVVTYLAEAPDRSIWVAYRDPMGISRIVLDQGHIAISHADPNGRPPAKAYFLRFDRRGWLWRGTDMGLDRFDGRAWAHFDRADGMALSDCDHNAFFDDPDGGIWVGTARGLSHMLNPAAAPRPLDAQAVITSFQLGALAAPAGAPASVPYSRRSLDAAFAALSFVNEEGISYRHRLVGLDETWTETQQAEAHYPGLPPGRYRFQMQAAAAPGQWSPPAEVAFAIQPPWWRQWWTRLGGALIAVAATRKLWRWRVQSMLRRQQELENAVADRTRKIALEHKAAVQQTARAEAERQKVEKQKVEIERLLWEARQAERVKTEFLANMSHEVRTPLNAIVGLTDVMLQSASSKDQVECLQMVKLSSDSLLALINGVLDFSKIEAGRLALDCAEFQLAALIEGTLKSLEGLARPKGLELRSRLAPNLPDVAVGDAVRLRQVLVNLAGNAIKFTERGSVEISAETQSVAAGSAIIQITVRDTGIGILPEQQALIFEPFRQADGSTSRRYGGTGLGLPLSARLVSLMNGRIWLESIPSAGSAFHFTVRLGLSTPSPPSPRTAAPAPAPPASASGLHILLVEDNVVNRKLAFRILENSGNTVCCAADGREALETCKSAAFDLILMDVQMPVMDGLEATAELRRREKPLGRHTPVLALTANAMQGDRERCLAAGMDGYITKPIRAGELLEAIAGVIGVPGRA